MKNSKHRDFIKKSIATIAGIKSVSAIAQPAWGAFVRGANDDVRATIVGLKKKGRQYLSYFGIRYSDRL
jgi:hypothetical protein